MASITLDGFKMWLDMYGTASRENDPKASTELFTRDAEYYETPFDDPMVGEEAIYQYWSEGAKNLKDKESSFEILAVKRNLGIARWRSNFVNVNSGNRVALDCVFLVEFDEHEKCRVFREWWHHQVIDADPKDT